MVFLLRRKKIQFFENVFFKNKTLISRSILNVMSSVFFFVAKIPLFRVENDSAIKKSGVIGSAGMVIFGDAAL